MTEEYCHPFNQYYLTEDVLEAEALNVYAEPGESKPNKSLLFDERLDTLLKGYADTFDCIIISHIPLSKQGEQTSEEDNESRCWIRGSSTFPNNGVTLADIEYFLRGWISLLREIHTTRKSLFLHPYLFHDREFKKSAPPLCWSVIEGGYNKKEYTQAQIEELGSVTLLPHKGYHHTANIAIYGQRELQDFWDIVWKRMEDNNLTAEKDAEECIHSQIRKGRDYLCTWLYKGKPRTRATAVYACPTSVLTRREPSDNQEIASGIAGIFWLTLVTKGTKWGEKEEDGAKRILKAAWLLALSDHLHRKQEADERRGMAEGMLAAAHDMSRAVMAISRDNPAKLLDLIREYFELIVSQLIERAEDNEPGKRGLRYPYGLQDFCTKAAHTAGGIEQMIRLVKGSSDITEETASAEIDSMEAWVRKMFGEFESLQDVMVGLTPREATAFRLGLTEALRNVIRHTKKSEKENEDNENVIHLNEIRIEVGLNPENDRLVIKNTVLKRWDTHTAQGKATGTLGSLKIYAKGYNCNANSVELRRLSSEPFGKGSAKFKETWQTVLPIPNTTGAKP